jgi:prepilin-type N-terminal cleavage/methylation domain-containing protein
MASSLPHKVPGYLATTGFTLMEVMAVLAIISLLAGLGVPAWAAMANKAKVRATRIVVESLALACLDNPQLTLTATDGSLQRAYDLDHDGILDGDPAHADPSSALQTLAPDAYHGAIRHAEIALPAWAVNELGQPMDRWRHPLRIAFGTRQFGSKDLGIWSVGPDGISAPNDPNADDIRSWHLTP